MPAWQAELARAVRSGNELLTLLDLDPEHVNIRPLAADFPLRVPRGFVRRMRAEGFRRREYRHFVFDRDGEPCHRCETEIEKVQVAGRRLYYCPECQGNAGSRPGSAPGDVSQLPHPRGRTR